MTITTKRSSSCNQHSGAQASTGLKPKIARTTPPSVPRREHRAPPSTRPRTPARKRFLAASGQQPRVEGPGGTGF